MSRRWTRALLRLYPARIRRRYGAELLDLQDQMRAEGALSSARLVRDVLTGAFLARSARRRAAVLSVAVLLTALVAAGITLPPGGRRVRRVPIAARAWLVASAQQTTPYYYGPDDGSACFIGSGTSCSLSSCAVPVTSADQAATVPHPARKAATRRARAACVASSHTPQPRALPVTTVSTATPQGR